MAGLRQGFFLRAFRGSGCIGFRLQTCRDNVLTVTVATHGLTCGAFQASWLTRAGKLLDTHGMPQHRQDADTAGAAACLDKFLCEAQRLLSGALQRSHSFFERAGRCGAQGPPGTGKTRTLLALLQVLATANAMKPKRFAQVGPILACGDTNAATDNLVEGLLERGVRVVRIGLPSKVRIARPKLTSLGSQGGCPRLFELSIAEPLKHVRSCE